MHICSKCKKIHSRQNQQYCSECHAEYMRKWREVQKKSDVVSISEEKLWECFRLLGSVLAARILPDDKPNGSTSH